MNLGDAISAAEKAQQDFSNANTQTANDRATVTAAQAKLDVANATVASDVTAMNSAADAFNAALDALIQAATAAKIPPASAPTAP